MSMTKTAPDGLKARECKRIKLRKPPPVPYVPVKDEVQEEVARMRNMEIKTTLEKDTTLNFPVWQENGTRKGFLMHVTAVLNAIKKRGHFMDYNKAAFKYKEASKAIASARAGLSLLEKSSFNDKKGKKRPGTNPTARVPKKACFAKNCNLCKKHGGAHMTHNTGECRKYEKDGTEKSSFRAAKKGGKRSYPSNQNFVQLTKKIKKLEKALKKSGKEGKKRRYEDSDSDSE